MDYKSTVSFREILWFRMLVILRESCHQTFIGRSLKTSQTSVCRLSCTQSDLYCNDQPGTLWSMFWVFLLKRMDVHKLWFSFCSSLCMCAHCSSSGSVAVTDSVVVVMELELLLVYMMNMQAQLMRLIEQKIRCIIRGYVLSKAKKKRRKN